MFDSKDSTSDLFNTEDTIHLIIELIQNKCVNPPGNEMRSIKTIQRVLLEHDIESQVFETAPDRGNLLARIKGSNKGPSLMFGPAHVDVVPIETADSWSVEPFSGTVKDGFIWGRGASDMLSIVACQVQTFIKLYEEGFQPKGDLILFIVSDEEAGGTYGAEWMVQNHRELIETDYAVTESGGPSFSPGKIMLANGEKGKARKRLIFKGSPGHGATPFDSDNAVVKMGEAAHRISNYKTPITTRYLDEMASKLSLGFIQNMMFTNPLLLPFTLNRLKKQVPTLAKGLHALSRMTISPNIAHGGKKVNIIPENAYLDLDIRTLPGQDDEYVISHLRKALGPLAEEVEIIDIPREEAGGASMGNSSPTSSEFVDTMEKAVRKEIPNATLVPYIATGATDCRFLRELGVEAYGFSLDDPEMGLKDMGAHGVNERVSIKTIELTQKVYYHLAKDFLT